jgi:ABC-type dipeptide/oligopeptide/nickel transport system permease component
MIPVFLAVSVVTFIATNSAGNPIELIRIGLKNASPAQLAALADFYHVHDPIYTRYFLWLSQFVQGNLGNSLLDGSVAEHMFAWIGTTLELQLAALALSLLIGIPVGIYSARKQYSKADIAVTTTAIFGVSMPTFWLGIIGIIIFSLYLPWLPSAGALSPYPPWWWGNQFLDVIAHLIMPAAVLTLVSLAVIVRLIRANMLEVLRMDYILAGRASGLKDRTVIYKHALKNAVSPIVTVVGISLGTSLAGAPALETTFTWPGLGYQFVSAALVLDLPVVQGITMVITVMALAFNLVTDLVYAYLDPRVRLG